MSATDGWAPSVEIVDDVITAANTAAMHNLLDAPGIPPASGHPIPPLWHWLAFLPRVAQRELGADGHPKLGGFLPPVPPSRRMFAGGRLTFHRPLLVDQTIRRTSTVTSVQHKTGRTGELIFVTVSHDYDVADSPEPPAIHEEQDLVYRPINHNPPSPASTANTSNEPIPETELRWDIRVTPTLLFRFSALTYNAHRIHYDHRYATEQEGHPGLVVHGPLQAVALAELVRNAGRLLASFQFRALNPAYDDGLLYLRGEQRDDQTLALTAYDHRGRVTMEAIANS